MSRPEHIEFDVPNEPALIVTTGRREWFIFADDPSRPMPPVTGLGAAVLITRLRWWADRLEREQLQDPSASP